MFHIANENDIKSGRVADVYFERTKEILKKKDIHKCVVAEFIVKYFPYKETWGILTGIEECAELLAEIDKDIDVYCMEEGTVFGQLEPVLVIEGDYLDFCLYETALLGFLCQSSGIATKSARCKSLAQDRLVISFGARRIHPAIAPMVERSAYIGGCDGVACVKSAELLGLEPMGTVPHALILLMGGSINAMKAFNEIINPKIKRVALIDTLEDEKFEAIKVAEILGKDLYGVRFDTPKSRRGNFLEILREVRWELDLRGFKDIKLFVSGGIDEDQISILNPLVDAYGIGTSISNAPILDFAMDIVEIEARPMAKRGKLSGAKKVLRCPECFKKMILPEKEKEIRFCSCKGKYENLLAPLIKKGRLVRKLPKPDKIRDYVFRQMRFYKDTVNLE